MVGKRSIWVKPGRTDKWWENLYLGRMNDEEWIHNFRMRKADFTKLVSLIRPYMQSKDRQKFEKT